MVIDEVAAQLAGVGADKDRSSETDGHGQNVEVAD